MDSVDYQAQSYCRDSNESSVAHTPTVSTVYQKSQGTIICTSIKPDDWGNRSKTYTNLQVFGEPPKPPKSED